MMTDQFHHIEKQIVSMSFLKEQVAMQWQKEHADFIRTGIPRLLNDIFNELVPEHLTYKVAKLEVDLGKIGLHDFEKQIARQVSSKIREMLKESAQPYASGDLKSVRALSEVSIRDHVGVIVQADEEVLIESLLTFLDHGILRHKKQVKDLSTLEQKIVTSCSEDLLRNEQVRSRIKSSVGRTRLEMQFTASFSQFVISGAYGPEIREIEILRLALLNALENILPPGRTTIKAQVEFPKPWRIILRQGFETVSLLKKQFLISIYSSMLSQLSSPSEKRAYRKFLTRLTHSTNPALVLVKEVITSFPTELLKNTVNHETASKEDVEDGIPASSPTTDARGNSIEKKSITISPSDSTEVNPVSNVSDRDKEKPIYDRQQIPPLLSSGRVSDEKERSKKGESVNENVGKVSIKDPMNEVLKQKSENHSEDQPSPVNQRNPEALESERGIQNADELVAYYVEHAGLILCWPYLPRLFQNTGYLKDGVFVNHVVHERAVHLLGYIATSQQQPEEHELMICKLLAGWPIELPLAKELELFNQELSEADAMLLSLVRNWTILRNTSIESLRSSFLERDGKLVKEETGWRLIVEQKSYDMLLDYLPYSVSVIKLPWINSIIKADWA
jgi:Contractile injection system tape measure protein